MKKIEKSIARLGEIIEKYYRIIFCIILLLAIVLNVYKLGEIPNGIHADEAGMAYDAYSIANYGVDRFLKHFPVYLINFGGGQSAMYAYLTAIVIKCAGGMYNPIIIRLPAVILSIIEVIIAYCLVKEFYSKKQALLFMLLVTISPWHIMKSRWGLDAYLLSPMLLFSIYALMKAIKKKSDIGFIVSGILFGLTLYTYALSYIIVPVFLLLTFIYLIKKKMVNIKQIIAFSIPLIIFAVPLILMVMVQKGWINEINSFITIPKMHKSRLGEVNIKYILSNLSTLKYVFGDVYLTYNAIKGFGTLYYIGTIFMIMGLAITLFRLKPITITNKGKVIYSNKKSPIDSTLYEKNNSRKDIINLDVIMLFAFISNIFLACLTTMNVNKANGIFISATYFILVSLREIYKNIKPVFWEMIVLYAIMFVLFIKTYFVTLAKQEHIFFDNGMIELCRYLNKFEEREIYTEDINYIYNLYANPISPYEFYNDIETTEIYDGLEVIGYKNFHRYIDWSNIKDDAVYVLVNQRNVQKLQDKGFKLEKFNSDKFYILYKD